MDHETTPDRHGKQVFSFALPASSSSDVTGNLLR